MCLVGIDVAGDKILAVNVSSPGYLYSCGKMAGVKFATPVIESIERKIEIATEFPRAFDNKALA